MSSASLREVTAFLDDYLSIATIADDPRALNGLQLDSAREVRTVASAVDASESIIESACRQGAELLIVHHGLFWGGNQPLVGAYGRKIRRCFNDGLSVYAAHAPLDVHPEVGNNILLVRALGLQADGPLGHASEMAIGLVADCHLTVDELRGRINQAVGEHRLLGRGPQLIRRLGIISGAGGSYLEDAVHAGLDALLTGEASHHAAISAEELGIHLILAGHYRSERLGIQSLGSLLAEKLGLRHCFIDHDSGL